MSEQHLTTSALECSDLSAVTLRLQRYLGVEQPSYDHAYVRVSSDGSWRYCSWNIDDVQIVAFGAQGCSVPADCDDGLYGNGVETCDAGTCQPGGPVDCNDNDCASEPAKLDAGYGHQDLCRAGARLDLYLHLLAVEVSIQEADDVDAGRQLPWLGTARPAGRGRLVVEVQPGRAWEGVQHAAAPLPYLNCEQPTADRCPPP